jgi:peptidoglycan L-alanyl-D-glutamate endopeptidase CwlK
MINSRNIKDLHPKVQQLCQLFLNKCGEQGITILITSTFRDNESQNALYAKGRTIKGSKVTNARGGQSFHNWHVAFDFVPIVDGKPQWNDIELFHKCGHIGESVGLEWGGRFKRFKDLPHFQYTGGHDITYFQSGGEL